MKGLSGFPTHPQVGDGDSEPRVRPVEGTPIRHVVVTVVLVILAVGLFMAPGGVQSPNQDVVRAIYTAAAGIVVALAAAIWVED